MLGQLGFALPLMIFMGLEAVVGSLLLLPKPFNQPAILLARGAHHQVGRTIFYTLIGFFGLLLVSPLYDAVQIFKITNQPASDPTAKLDTTEHESRTLLQFTLTIASLAMLVFLRKLGDALDQLDRMSVSEAALLKQAKGLQSEYTRALGGDADATSADAVTADNIAAPPASPAVDSPALDSGMAGMGTNATTGIEAEVPDLRQRVGKMDMGLNEPLVMDGEPVGVAAKKDM